MNCLFPRFLVRLNFCLSMQISQAFAEIRHFPLVTFLEKKVSIIKCLNPGNNTTTSKDNNRWLQFINLSDSGFHLLDSGHRALPQRNYVYFNNYWISKAFPEMSRQLWKLLFKLGLMPGDCWKWLISLIVWTQISQIFWLRVKF